MFDRTTVIQQPTQVVDRNVTIHEHRAPTDQSVKLLREMEQKAQDEVVKAVRVGNTTFECVVQKNLNQASGLFIYRAIFKLNGQNLTAEVEASPREGTDIVFSQLRDAIAKKIATEVLFDGFVASMPGAF